MEAGRGEGYGGWQRGGLWRLAEERAMEAEQKMKGGPMWLQ